MGSNYPDKGELADSLGMARSTLYRRGKQEARDWSTKCMIEKVLRKFPSYGHKRLALHLRINKKRVLRVMKLYGIKPYRRRGRKPVKKAPNIESLYPNLLLTQYPTHLSHIWVSDFTYLPFKKSFVYLATVMDLYTREIVGFSLLRRHTIELVLNALLSTVQYRPRPEIIHSDQGREYTSKAYTQFVHSLGTTVSMSKKGCPWENGYQESFYSQFKVDLGDPNRFDHLGELASEVYRTIHRYNHYRIHTALKMAPHAFARRHMLELEVLE
jgi:putative transposase